MERWMISELWRELRNVARELGSLLVTLLPWLPAFVLAALALEHAGWQAAPVIVLLTPWYRWLLRGGTLSVRGIGAVLRWLLISGVSAAILRLTADLVPACLSGPVLILVALILAKD